MSVNSSQKRILLVDDEKSIRQVVGKRLESWGYDTFTAASGEEGVQLAEANQPDLVLLDIMMPKMHGRDVCAALKANPKTQRIPIIFLTALARADQIMVGMDLGADDYITKPYNKNELKHRIEVCLARHSTTTEEPGS